MVKMREQVHEQLLDSKLGKDTIDNTVLEKELGAWKRKYIELELENYKLGKYRDLYLASEESRAKMKEQLEFLEKRLPPDVTYNMPLQKEGMPPLTIEDAIDSMVFVVPPKALGKAIFANEKLYLKFNAKGLLEYVLTDTELIKMNAPDQQQSGTPIQ